MRFQPLKMPYFDEFAPSNSNPEQTLSLLYLKTSEFVDNEVAQKPSNVLQNKLMSKASKCGKSEISTVIKCLILMNLPLLIASPEQTLSLLYLKISEFVDNEVFQKPSNVQQNKFMSKGSKSRKNEISTVKNALF